MSERKIHVKPYMLQYTCDDCESKPNPGCLLRKVEVLLTSPPMYVYECPNCKKKYRFETDYSNIHYEPIQDM